MDTQAQAAGGYGAEEDAQQFDVDFTIMTQELSQFFKALMAAFGGEDLSDLAEAV